jgi:hypothetical protein
LKHLRRNYVEEVDLCSCFYESTKIRPVIEYMPTFDLRAWHPTMTIELCIHIGQKRDLSIIYGTLNRLRSVLYSKRNIESLNKRREYLCRVI